VIGIGNGRQAGGGQQLCPEALINDGLLELRIFTVTGYCQRCLPHLLSRRKARTSSTGNPPGLR
jgi:diacylglycerol kinase family enzyme